MHEHCTSTIVQELHQELGINNRTQFFLFEANGLVEETEKAGDRQ